MNYGTYPSPNGYPPPPPAGVPNMMPPQGPMQGYPQGVPPQGPMQGYPQGVPPQGPVQGYPQGVPPQGPMQGYPQGVPPQGPVQGYPQGVPPQGPVQGYPQGVPPQEPMQGYPQGVPPQEPVQGYPQGVPPQQPMQGYPQGVPPQGPVQGYPQGVPPQEPMQGYPQGVPPQMGTWNPYFANAYGGNPVGWYAPAYAPPFAVGGGKPPRDPRRYGASRTLNRMSLLVLAQTGLSFFWQIPLVLLLSLVGVDIYTNSLGYQWLTGILVPLSTALPFVAYLFFRKKDLTEYLKFEKVGFVGGLLCVLAGLGVVLLGNYPAIFVSNIFSSFGYDTSSAYISQADSLEAILLEIAVVAVLVPFMEEMVFRGVILSSLRKYGVGFSIVASALVFGLAHMSVSNVVFATIAGLVFGFLYAKTNNLWLTVIVHALNNFIAAFGTHTEFFFGDMAQMANVILMLGPIVLGVIALILLVLFKRNMFPGVGSPKYDGPSQPLRAGESAVAIVRAPAFWILVGAMVLYTIAMFFAAS